MLDSSCLFYFALLGLARRVGAMGSIYLLCPTCRLRRLTVWGLIFLFFPTIALVLTFLFFLFLFFIFHNTVLYVPVLGSYLIAYECHHGRRSRHLDQYGC